MKQVWTPDAIRKRWRASQPCDCLECRSACRLRPGLFLPEEIQRLADFFGLGLPDLYQRYLVLDHYTRFHGERPPEIIWMLAPGNHEEWGEVASFSYGTDRRGIACIFLTMEGRCSIHAVKPWECRWSHHAREGRGCKEAIVSLWDNDEARALIRNCGVDPEGLEPPPPTAADMIWFGLPERRT